MDLSEILAIAGRHGLFKSIAQTKNGIVVESLTDGKRFTAFSHERVSTLKEISIFTKDEEIELREVFKRIMEKTEELQLPDPKADKVALRTFFEEVVPEHDQERVYPSDIKKIIAWYNLLQEKELLEELLKEEKVEEEDVKPEEQEEEKKKEDTSAEAKKEIPEKKEAKKTPKAKKS